MNTIRHSIAPGVLAALLACFVAAQSQAAAPLPGDSVYWVDAGLTGQDGRTTAFADGRGEPRVVSMFYASCPFMCPLIIDTIRQTEHALPEAARRRFKVLLVSFDAERDTPAALKAMAEKRHLDTPRWTLAHARAPDVRRIAAVLGIRYRALQDGGFSHASVLVLLDPDGRIMARSETMGHADPQFVAAAATLLASP